MTTSLFLLTIRFTVGLPEIVIFQIGAIVLGFCIHLFIVSRRTTIEKTAEPIADSNVWTEDWKMKYYSEMDQQEIVQKNLQDELKKTQANEDSLAMELDKLRSEIVHLQHEYQHAMPVDTSEYMRQLKDAQEHLFTHNQKVQELLAQVGLMKDTEKKYVDILHINESLHEQVKHLQASVSEKEIEIRNSRHHQKLSEEMKGRLEKAYKDYNTLQEQLHKLETHLSQSRLGMQGFDELQEAYFKLTKEFDELKLRQISLMEENQRLSRTLSDTEDKLRESNFQRQQSLKKVSFLEELNHDLQQVSEHSKKLQSQFRRINEIETMLNRASFSQDRGDVNEE